MASRYNSLSLPYCEGTPGHTAEGKPRQPDLCSSVLTGFVLAIPAALPHESHCICTLFLSGPRTPKAPYPRSLHSTGVLRASSCASCR